MLHFNPAFPWHVRLAMLDDRPDYVQSPEVTTYFGRRRVRSTEELEIEIERPGMYVEALPVLAVYDYDPGEPGGRHSPGEPEQINDVEAWFHRPGKGYQRVDLTPSERADVEELIWKARERREDY